MKEGDFVGNDAYIDVSPNEEHLSFTFSGDNSVDVALLIKSLEGICNAYKNSVKAQYTDANVAVNVEAFNKGSFEVLLAPIVEVLPTILPQIPQTVSTVKTFLDIVKLKHDLKGKKAKSLEQNGDKYRVTNEVGEISYHDCNVTNIYLQTPIIDKSLADTFAVLNSNQSKESVRLSTGDYMTEIPKCQYENMSRQLVEENSDENFQTHSSIIHADLLLKKPDLLGESKWEFQHNGKRISATIEDKHFLDGVKTGRIKALYAGVRVPVELQIEVTLDKNLDEISKKYTILSVTGNIIEPEEYQQMEF